MEVKNHVCLEVEKEGHAFRFFIPVGAPYGACFDAGYEFLSAILEMQKTAAEKVQEKKPVDENAE